MKKKLAMLLTAAMLVGSLAACGSSDNGSSATGSASATDSTKTDAAATEVSTEGKQSVPAPRWHICSADFFHNSGHWADRNSA